MDELFWMTLISAAVGYAGGMLTGLGWCYWRRDAEAIKLAEQVQYLAGYEERHERIMKITSELDKRLQEILDMWSCKSRPK